VANLSASQSSGPVAASLPAGQAANSVPGFSSWVLSSESGDGGSQYYQGGGGQVLVGGDGDSIVIGSAGRDLLVGCCGTVADVVSVADSTALALHDAALIAMAAEGVSGDSSTIGVG
jgi:hypothetical protein